MPPKASGAYGVSDLIFLYRRPHLILWITVAGAAANFVAAWPLIALYGVTGAALAALLGTAAAALARRALLRSSFGIAVPLRHSAAPLLAAAASLAAALVLMTMPFADRSARRHAVAALAIYWGVLRVALRLTGESARSLISLRSVRCGQWRQLSGSRNISAPSVFLHQRYR